MTNSGTRASGFDEDMEKVLNDKVQEMGSIVMPGRAYLFFGVTRYTLGRVVAVNGTFAVLKQASWCAAVGRQMNALKSGTLEEVEPYPEECWPVVVNLNAVNDWCVWPHELPKDQK